MSKQCKLHFNEFEQLSSLILAPSLIMSSPSPIFLPHVFYIKKIISYSQSLEIPTNEEVWRGVQKARVEDTCIKSPLICYDSIQIYTEMDRIAISNFIQGSGIGIDSITLNETINFLESHVGHLTQGLEEYEMLSATAIVGETIFLDDITNTKIAKTGITLEHVMRHIGKLSKEEYLDVLTRQVAKWREAPLWLKTKTQNLKCSYRVYKKYRSAFDELCYSNTLMQERSRFNLMAIFWILYMFVKHEHQQFDNLVESTSLLHAIILFSFAEVSAQISHKQSSSIFRKQFKESQTPTGGRFTHLKELLIEKLNQVHSFRYEGKEIDLQQLATDTNYAQRFLDDISNLFDKFKTKLPDNTINQISFLELTKNLTPLLIRRHQATPSIQKRIDFDKSDDEEQDPIVAEKNNPQNEEETAVKRIPDDKQAKTCVTSKRQPLSPFRPFTAIKGLLTPVSARHQNLGWVNGITSKFIEEQGNQVKKIYEKYTKKDYKSYQLLALRNITEAICEFTPECMDFQKRQRSIYHFFEHFINRIAESHMEVEMIAIFSQDTNFNSILCLAVDLFNFAYQSLEGPYRKYCKIFGITLLQGHKPINWFGKNITKPKNIEGYLYDLQKKILIEEIWENNEGYLLLSNVIQLKKYHNQALLRRLHQHVNERTQELCDKMHIQEREVTRIVNLVKFILEKRQILLKNHRIDQIIVCSIASILSINRSRSCFSLEEIFSHYNQLILSFFSNKNSLFDEEGNQIDLIGFYNAIFLPSVEQIINSEEHAGILATPIRIERRKSKQLGLEMTPIAKKFRQAPSLIIPPRRITLGELMTVERNDDTQEVNHSYRSLLANSLKNIDSYAQQLEQQQEDYPSPTFGGIKVPSSIFKGFSFSDIHDKR